MANKYATSRLRKEMRMLMKEPVDNIEACPLDSNILEFHYVIRGPKGSPYEVRTVQSEMCTESCHRIALRVCDHITIYAEGNENIYINLTPEEIMFLNGCVLGCLHIFLLPASVIYATRTSMSMPHNHDSR